MPGRSASSNIIKWLSSAKSAKGGDPHAWCLCRSRGLNLGALAGGRHDAGCRRVYGRSQR